MKNVKNWLKKLPDFVVLVKMCDGRNPALSNQKSLSSLCDSMFLIGGSPFIKLFFSKTLLLVKISAINYEEIIATGVAKTKQRR